MNDTNQILKKDCLDCKAYDREREICKLGNTIGKITYETDEKIIITGKPLEPCTKPIDNIQYIKELEHYIGVLRFELNYTKENRNDWKDMYLKNRILHAY